MFTLNKYLLGQPSKSVPAGIKGMKMQTITQGATTCIDCGQELNSLNCSIRGDGKGFRSQCKPCRSTEYANSPEIQYVHWASHLRRNFGMTPEEYDEKYKSQNGLCAICHKPETCKVFKGQETIRRLSVDHDHTYTKGDPRGNRDLLCRACNHMVGNSQEDETNLFSALTYVVAWKTKQISK